MADHQLLVTIDLAAPAGPGDAEDLRRLLLARVPGATAVHVTEVTSAPLPYGDLARTGDRAGPG